MRVIKSLVFAVVILLAASLVAAEAPKWHELQGYSFDRFEGDFNRRYSTADERAFRRQVFERRLARIQEHNANPHRTYNKGVNHFADWTEQEFKAYNTASPRYAERFFASAAESSAPQLPFYQYNATGALTPRSVDYRLASPPVLTGVKNQGACGSCWAHSTVETIESMFAIRFGQLPVLSQQQVSACTAMMDGCGGGTYWYGWQYVSQSGGLNEEWLYPYTDFFAKNESKAATAACRNITADFLPNFSWLPKANVSAMTIVDPNNATALMEALAFKGPISIAVGASDWSDYEGGIFLNPFNSSVPFEIDHAVQAVGYGYDTTVDLGYWIVRNSWGTSWGESGFIRLYRPTSGAPEPCSNATGQLTCGTSGILFQPGYPTVTMLAKKNL